MSNAVEIHVAYEVFSNGKMNNLILLFSITTYNATFGGC